MAITTGLAHIPFVVDLGMRYVRSEGGESELRLTITPRLTNNLGVAHGGVVMSLLDVAMAQAARSVPWVDAPAGATNPKVATIEMKTSFMRAGEGELVGRGKLLHRTRNMAFCEASVFDMNGALCAHATGTFKYTDSLRASGSGAAGTV